jgi:hypothetical protein
MSEQHRLQVQHERQFSSGVLSVTTRYRLIVTGDVGLKEIGKLIRILQLQKEILEESDDADAPSTHQQGP